MSIFTWTPPWLTVNTFFRCDHPDDDRIWQVRSVVDDQVIVRHWRIAKKRWEYSFFDQAAFQSGAVFVEVPS